MRETKTNLHTLKRAGVEVELAGAYEDALDRCRPWLAMSSEFTRTQTELRFASTLP